MNPKVSIVVPVYNMEEYLCKCLDSILHQTLNDIEIIVVNDGSTDNSQNIIDEYVRKDSRIKPVIHKKNKGLLITRQTGVQAASGEFIGHVDADDYIDPCMYETMYKKAIEDSADIVQCGMARVKDGEEVPHGKYENKTLVGRDILKNLLTFKLPHSHCSKIVRRSLWVDHFSLFPNDGTLRAEDFLPVAYLCTYAKKLVVITNPFYKYLYRSTSGSLSQSDHSIANRAFSVAHHVAVFRDFLIRTNRLHHFEKELAHVERRYYLTNAMAPLFSLENETNIKDILRKIVNFNGWEPLMNWTVQSLEKRKDFRGLKVLYHLKDEISREKKILCVLPSLTKGKGGAENVVIEMAQALTLKGAYSFVLLGNDEMGSKPTWDIPESIDVVVQPYNKKSLERLVSRLKPDLVFCITSSHGIVNVVKRYRHLGVPLVVQECASPNRILRLWSEGQKISIEQASELRNAFMSMVTKIRLVMPGYEKTLPDFLRKDIHVYVNAIKSARQIADVKSQNNKRKKIINVGGLKPNKNILPLLEAFATLKDEYPMWDVVICGEGTERQATESFLRKHQLIDRVELPGNIEDIYSVYEDCQIHVITSLEEGNPLAVCESMVHAIPSIGFVDCSGTNSLINNNKNGLLVDSLDRHSSLVNAMRKLMGDGKKRYSLGQQALIDSKEFDSEKIYSKWDELFKSALKYRSRSEKKLEERLSDAPKIMQRYLDQTGVMLPSKREREQKSIVLFSIRNYDSAGGVQLSTTRLANHLVEEGFEVALVPHKTLTKKDLYYKLHKKVKFDSIPFAANQRNILEYKAELERIIKAYKPNAVAVLMTGYANFYISMLLSSSNIPVLTTERGEPDFLRLSKGTGNRLGDFLFADKIHLLFDRYKTSIGDGLGEKVSVIPSPIPIPVGSFALPSKPNSNGRYKISFCGRIDYEKDVFTLINAFELIHDKYTDWDLEIIGSGPLLEATKSHVSNELETRVHFTNQVTMEEVAEYYRSANIFAFPTLTEGCPLALREAMSYKVPVIGFSDAGGVYEVLKDGGGILIANIDEDEIKARAEILSTHKNYGQMPVSKAVKLASEIEILINDPALRDRLGAEGHQVIRENYSINKIHKQWVALFEDMIANGKNTKSYPQRIKSLFDYNITLQNSLSKAKERKQTLAAELLAAEKQSYANKRRYEDVKNSKTFRIATIVRLAIFEPGRNTFMLPISIWRVLKS